ncbi:transketolase [Rhodoblastus acidophilus]|uniref:transketolase n=1 Tax=Rhodoblastus acidophilus TaxID=1074 RepID=UPI002223FB34|nr:transketolase [Rhodoblastus acidophilus]MCW2317334.1 transketolase [Rhodoblastus acidophilus]
MPNRKRAPSPAPGKSGAPGKSAAAGGAAQRPPQTSRGVAAPARETPAKIAPARDLDRLCIDTMRTLAMDAVQKANSGHPGTPMALAPVMYALWRNVLRYDPEDAAWLNRDRFILSNGHASMLLYATLHLAGVKRLDASQKPTGAPAVSLDDIKAFRQLDSVCPGHPEHYATTGVEATTGPLGQGCGMSVGMAMAERWLAQNFNRPGFEIFDYAIYALCSDGDMMEGISNEAASLAGHLRLSNLCWIYDDNQVTIEGHTGLAFDDDVAMRFRAYGWNVERVADANDTQAVAAALKRFRETQDAPTLIVVKSHIGYGAPHKQDHSAAHGEPLGEEEVRLAKRAYGWPEDSSFLVPRGVREHFQQGMRGGALRRDWLEHMRQYRAGHPDLAERLDLMQTGGLPEGWDSDLPEFPPDAKGLATREASGQALNAIAKKVPWLVGGAADLAPSTKSNLTFDGAGEFELGYYGGRNLHFGIREHAMGAALNGLALSKLRVYSSTFLIFSDYLKPAIRLGALMGLPVIHIFTHDSIGLGEDGPTHQPIEQLAGLRAIPNLLTLRPADANETVEAWRVIMRQAQPACLVLSRQKLPTLDRSRYASAEGVSHGAYVLADTGENPDVILIGTGGEVSLCLEAFEELARDGVAARVVSMPSWDLFERQDRAYRDAVLPPQVTARVCVEAASPLGWDRYVGATGAKIAMCGFGASAPAGDLMVKFGFTRETVVAAARRQLENSP